MREPIAQLVWPYFVTVGMVAVAIGVAYLTKRFSTSENLSLVFLTPVLLSALRYGLWPSVGASILGVLAWDFFFQQPYYSLRISDPRDLLALIFFLIVALIISNLAAMKLRQAEVIGIRAKSIEQLYDFSQTTASAASLADLLSVIAHRIGNVLGCEAVILLPEADRLNLRVCYPENANLSAADMNAAQWAWTRNQPTGQGTAILPEASHRYLALGTSRGIVGVIGIDSELPSSIVTEEQQLLAALLNQAAVAIERAELAETIDQARLQAETERLRSAMLTSVSHDLRTPLTTIIAAHSTLKSLGDACDTAVRDELIDRAQEEAERLDRFIGNLLDMTKLDSGNLNLRLEPIDLQDAVESALTRAHPLTLHHTVEADMQPDLPMARADFMLLEQVIFNLIDNAAKYAPAGTKIEIGARAGSDAIILEVRDEGDGIPTRSLEKIFNKFERVTHEDRQRPGTGLGLAISRGFLDAVGGTIKAGNRDDRSGAIFTIRLPIAQIST
jgi:two-component system sensor histidine kinase KdpD